jgi:hypothetical protein
LVCISGKPARYADWGCDLCKQPIPHDTRFVMHCDKCSSDGPVPAGVASGFDICPTCVGKARDLLNVWPLVLNAAGCPMFPGIGEYWQTLYCHRLQAPFPRPASAAPSFCFSQATANIQAPCGPREGAQCMDCKRGQDALIAVDEGKVANRAGRVMKHVCYGARAGTLYCSECSESQVQCADCKFSQENLPNVFP